MAVENENVEKLREWLAEGSPVRSAYASAGTLVEKLAAVVFQGEWAWPDYPDRVGAYREALRDRFEHDSVLEYQFIELTGPDADPGVFVDWFLSVLLEWEEAAENDVDGAEEDEEGDTGWLNQNHDGTPGTEFYRIDEATGEYLYAASANDTDWATYEQRRYSEPAWHEGYGLDHRYDRRDGVYEWYDETAGTWNGQTWADQYAAGRRAPAAETPPASTPEPAWGDDWKMFYRVDPNGEYEFADAVIPGQRASGCGDIWLSHEQVLARDIQESTDGTPDQAVTSLQTEIREAIASVFKAKPELRVGLTDADIADIIAEMSQDATGH